MALEIKFISSVQNNETDSELIVKTTSKFIFITLKDKQSKNPFGECIFLDKYTASKLAKELRKQISFLED